MHWFCEGIPGPHL